MQNKSPQLNIIYYYFIFFTFSCFCSSLAFDWKCAGCKTGVEVLRYLYEQNYTTTEILKTAEYVCRHFADQDSFVCRGITSQFKDEFLYVLGKLVFQPSQLCGLILNGCGTPINPFDTNWNVTLPPYPTTFKKLNSKSSTNQTNRTTPIRILQLSDIHFDPDYLEGSEADCEGPVCCFKKPKKGMPLRKKAGYWGTAARCDIPLRTVENLLEHINRTHKLDFVLLSGDYLHHRDWEYTREGHLSAIANLSKLLQQHLPEIPIFWALGNHEAVPVNAFGPHFVPEQFRPTWMYQALLTEAHKTDKGHLPDEADESFVYRGSYAVDYGNLRLISLNNGYCDNTNMFIYINQTDPDGSLTWLVDQLWNAEKNGKFVYILSHIPPGDEECLESWSRNYYRIVIRFEQTIKGQFFGHTHYDSFSLFFTDMNNRGTAPLSVLFTAPSVTTFEGLNPAYRIYSVNPTDWEILDFETYFLNLSNTQTSKQSPKWEFLYSAKDEYKLNDLSASEWNELIKRIEKDPEIIRKFNRNYIRRDDAFCGKKCMEKRICSIRASHHNEKELCKDEDRNRRIKLKLKAIINFFDF
ncbi:hypothetical protein ACQ4LE_009248 [Meloidogyne hapla]